MNYDDSPVFSNKEGTKNATGMFAAICIAINLEPR